MDGNDDWRRTLTAAQRQAADHGDGPLLVVAGAGTGKTTTLACRVAARAVVGEAPRPIAVGLSGGADSLALTAALVAEGHEVTALCVDHGLQSGSAAQARRAAEQARGMGAAAQVVRVDVAKHGSLEAAARAARYRAWLDREGVVEVASRPVEVADTIGAGDTFGAALIDALWERGRLGAEHRAGLGALPREEVSEVLEHAARAAAVTVSRPGADPPYRRELG